MSSISCILYWDCLKHSSLPLGPLQPSSPSTKELHGLVLCHSTVWMLLGSDPSNISSVNRLSIKKLKHIFKARNRRFLVGKYFSQLARWRRLAAAVVDVVIVVVRRFDLGTNTNQFMTKLKPVWPDWAIFIEMGDTFCLQK